jgi:hypothetical protein
MSSAVRIFSRNGRTGNFQQIGLIQSFKPTDTRKMERARGIGFGDRVAEIVPGLTDVSITVSRMCMYDINILESYGYDTGYNLGAPAGKVRTLAHQKNPFDINEVLVFHYRQPESSTPGFNLPNQPAANLQNYTSFWYYDCWMNNWARSNEITGNLIYMEDVNIDVTWVNDGQDPGIYQSTDEWDMHGLNCQQAGVFDEVTSGFASFSPGGDPNKQVTASTVWAGVNGGSNAGGGTGSFVNC